MPADKSSKLKAMTKSAPSEQQPNLSDSDISPQNQEALLQIASLIRLAESFRLGFVKCNQPIQCLQIVNRLKEMLAGEANIITVNLKEPVSSLRRAVLQALESDSLNVHAKMAIIVLGFERSIPSEGPAPALDELNQSRDNFPKSFSSPFLIWLPDYALTRLAREAPDFWGWRSGVFEFSPEQKLIDLMEKTMAEGEEEDRLSLADKKELASALVGLIRDYQELDRGEREDRALAVVLLRLAGIRRILGDYDEARRLYQQSLEIAQELGDKSGVSKSLNQLGMLAYLTGDYAEARQLYQQSLEIAQELGDKSGVSKSLHRLGILAKYTGDYSEARQLYQQSLEIAQELGDKSGVSKSLHNLGILAQDTGDYAEARKLYQQSLDIKQELGNKRGVSGSLHQLGILAQYTGDYAEARQLYQQSLDIKQELGDKSGSAISLAQFSLLEEEEGHLDKALMLIKQAETLFLELKSPMATQARKAREWMEKKLAQSWRNA
jgi:tetratricopeptide (TPR) repeat protein